MAGVEEAEVMAEVMTGVENMMNGVSSYGAKSAYDS